MLSFHKCGAGYLAQAQGQYGDALLTDESTCA